MKSASITDDALADLTLWRSNRSCHNVGGNFMSKVNMPKVGKSGEIRYYS